jgi:hypothetical protein
MAGLVPAIHDFAAATLQPASQSVERRTLNPEKDAAQLPRLIRREVPALCSAWPE